MFLGNKKHSEDSTPPEEESLEEEHIDMLDSNQEIIRRDCRSKMHNLPLVGLKNKYYSKEFEEAKGPKSTMSREKETEENMSETNINSRNRFNLNNSDSASENLDLRLNSAMAVQTHRQYKKKSQIAPEPYYRSATTKEEDSTAMRLKSSLDLNKVSLDRREEPLRSISSDPEDAMLL